MPSSLFLSAFSQPAPLPPSFCVYKSGFGGKVFCADVQKRLLGTTKISFPWNHTFDYGNSSPKPSPLVYFKPSVSSHFIKLFLSLLPLPPKVFPPTPPFLAACLEDLRTFAIRRWLRQWRWRGGTEKRQLMKICPLIFSLKVF